MEAINHEVGLGKRRGWYRWPVLQTGYDRANTSPLKSSSEFVDRGVFRFAKNPNYTHWGQEKEFEGEVEPCNNGGVLALSGYFGRPSESLAGRLVAEQLEDGGWNCDAPASHRSSFHTTICVLEGLFEYERAVGPIPEIADARSRGEAYLLERGLFRRRSTGEVANPEFLELAFPPRYHDDVLRALDYFRATGASPHPRTDEAVHFIESRRQPDGRWLLDRACDEALHVSTGEHAGEPAAGTR